MVEEEQKNKQINIYILYLHIKILFKIIHLPNIYYKIIEYLLTYSMDTNNVIFSTIFLTNKQFHQIFPLKD